MKNERFNPVVAIAVGAFVLQIARSFGVSNFSMAVDQAYGELAGLLVAFLIGGALFWCCLLLGLATGSFGTNLFHKWAHEPNPPVVVRWLQRSRLILGPERHQHHHSDYSRGFCVTSGWMNPVLDALGFFPRLERVVRFFKP